MVDLKEEPKPKPESSQELTEEETDKVSGGVGGLQTGLDPSKTKPTQFGIGAASPLHPDQAMLGANRIL
jgi:hypothetical protein